MEDVRYVNICSEVDYSAQWKSAYEHECFLISIIVQEYGCRVSHTIGYRDQILCAATGY